MCSVLIVLVSGFYSAFGLKRSDEHPERQDHIVLELEFVACLLGLERQAAQSDDPLGAEQAATCRDALARFVREHLCWWSPTFAVLLAKEAGGGYYHDVGVFLAALVPALRSLLDVPAPALPSAVAPSSAPRPEECEQCPIP